MTCEEAKQVFIDRGFVNGIFDGDKWRQSIIIISEWLQSIQPKPPAKWQRVLDGAWFYEQCTACNTVHDVKSNYCPNCGAKMEGSEDGKNL